MRLARRIAPVAGGSRPPLTLVHGFTQNAGCWGTFAEELGRDRELVLIDAPGHGTATDVRSDLAEGARRLGQLSSPHLLGYSMGGRFSLAAALAAPDRIRRLVLIGTTAGIDDPVERQARRRSDQELADRVERVGVEAFLTEWLAGPLFAGLDAGAAGLAGRLTNTAEGLASSLRLAGSGTYEPYWERLGSLKAEVLVVAGEHDARYRSLGQRLAQATGGRLEIIPGAGHAAHLERPEATAEAVRRFLDGPVRPPDHPRASPAASNKP